MHRGTAAALGIEDDGWVWVISRNGRLKCQVRLMEGVNPDTVWTWNAIGKRRGAWNLADDAPESERGFLLNHVISEFCSHADGRPSTPTRSPARRRGTTCACGWKRPTARPRRCRTRALHHPPGMSRPAHCRATQPKTPRGCRGASAGRASRQPAT